MTEPTADHPLASRLASLGPRALRRPEPRASIAVAGAGCALAVLGVLIVSGDRGSSGDDFNQWPGALLSAAVVAAGFFTLTQVRRGPLATGGAVAALLGVPPLLFFLTWDDGGLPPYSTEGILIFSTVIWLAAYLWSPGRGRSVFLAAGLIGAWASLLQLTEKVFDAPYGFFGDFFFFGPTATFDETSGEIGGDPTFGGDVGDIPQIHMPDWTAVGMLSLFVGIGYLVLTRRVDRRGYRGAGTPVAFATIPPLVVGVVALADELQASGTGLVAMLLGAAVCWHGAGLWRRGTTWIGAAAVAFGAAVFLGDMTDDATVGGMLYLAAGIALVFAAHAWATGSEEADELAVTDLSPVLATVATEELVADADPEPAPDDDSEWAPPED